MPVIWNCYKLHHSKYYKYYGLHGFAMAGLTAWNSLPASLHDKQLSVTSFRCK